MKLRNWLIFSLAVAVALAALARVAQPQGATEWSAIVQAIGSVAAIAAVALVAHEQHSATVAREERAMHLRQVDLLGAPVAQAYRVHNKLHVAARVMRRSLGTKSWDDHGDDEVQSAAEEVGRFESLPLHSLSNSHFEWAARFLESAKHCLQTLRTIQSVRSRESAAPNSLHHDFDTSHEELGLALQVLVQGLLDSSLAANRERVERNRARR